MYIEFSNLKDLLSFNIKYYRYMNNMSQELLAEQCSLSPRYITDVERGKHCPTIPNIEKIAHALHIEAYVLFQNNNRRTDIIEKMNSARQYNQKKIRIPLIFLDFVKIHIFD